MCKLFGVNAIVIITSRFHCGSQFSIPCEDNYTCELNCLYLFKAPSINLLFGQCFCLLNYLFGYCVIYLAISVFTVGLRKEESVILKTETDEIKNPLDVFLHFAIYVIS